MPKCVACRCNALATGARLSKGPPHLRSAPILSYDEQVGGNAALR